VLQDLVKLILTVLLGMLIQYLFFGFFIYFFAKLSPFPFYRKSLEYQALAFSSSSSKAALSTTMKVCRENLGISNSNTSFVLPLGAAMNMDGMAIYLGICAIFFAQVTGVQLAIHDYLVIILTATVGSIGGAGIPGASMIMLPMILNAINVPLEGVALIAGIDRILDMIRTTINITGDATVTLIIDKNEGTLDEEIYYS
jgi:Na+/H+-dicarboxylate symporter